MILTLLFLLANAATVARASQRSSHPSKGTKVAVGVALYIPGQLTLNVILVVTARVLAANILDAGIFLPSVIGAVVAGLWLMFGLYWFYGWVFSRLGRVSDVHA